MIGLYVTYDTSSAIMRVSEYDNNENEIKRTDYKSNGYADRGYEYDASGNEIKLIIYSGGVVDEYFVRTYDTNGLEIRSDIFDGDGTFTGWMEFVYNAYGWLVKTIIYDADGTVGAIINE